MDTRRKPTKVWTLYRPPGTAEAPFLDDGPLLDSMGVGHFGRKAEKYVWESVERSQNGGIYSLLFFLSDKNRWSIGEKNIYFRSMRQKSTYIRVIVIFRFGSKISFSFYLY